MQVDISKEETLQAILDFLKDHFPESLYMWYFLWYIQRGLISIEHVNPEVFLNDLTELKSVVIVYSFDGFSNNKPKTTSKKVIIFQCDSHSIDLVESMIKQYLLWNTSTELVIAARGARFLPMLEQLHKNIKNEKSREIHQCSVMEIDRSTFEETKQKFQHIPDEMRVKFCFINTDIDIRPLSVIDADLINDSWVYKSDTSLGQIKYQTEHLPTLGAYRHEKLVSWRLLQYDGSLGMARTIDKERRKGLSSILNIKLAEQVFQMQDHVFCSIVKTNQPSIELLTKLGYRFICDEYWLYL